MITDLSAVAVWLVICAGWLLVIIEPWNATPYTPRHALETATPAQRVQRDRMRWVGGIDAAYARWRDAVAPISVDDWHDAMAHIRPQATAGEERPTTGVSEGSRT